MRMTIVVPIMGEMHDIKGILGNLVHTTSQEVNYLFIDNGSPEPIEGFIRTYLKPREFIVHRNAENIGCFKTIQQAYEMCDSDILAFLHNDLMIYEKAWDMRVVELFETIPDLGLVSFFGGQRLDRGCGRGQNYTNMLEAEIHGTRLIEDYKPIVVCDGLAMICSRKMLEANNGIDQRYHYHHREDFEMSMASLSKGFKNIVVNIPCHHWNGITANRGLYQTWLNTKMSMENADLYTHNENTRLFDEKWKHLLPLKVNDDFSFEGGIFKGNPSEM